MTPPPRGQRLPQRPRLLLALTLAVALAVGAAGREPWGYRHRGVALRPALAAFQKPPQPPSQPPSKDGSGPGSSGSGKPSSSLPFTSKLLESSSAAGAWTTTAPSPFPSPSNRAAAGATTAPAEGASDGSGTTTAVTVPGPGPFRLVLDEATDRFAFQVRFRLIVSPGGSVDHQASSTD